MNDKKKYSLWMTMIKYFILWMVGGSVYYMIEIFYRGYSHSSMFIVGGICFLLIGAINEIFPWQLYLEVQLLLGDIAVLIVEFIAGCIVNIWLGLNVWDYSNLPCNLLGQICLPFAILWIPVVALAVVVDDWIKWRFMNEEAPRYYIWICTKIVKGDDGLIIPFVKPQKRKS